MVSRVVHYLGMNPFLQEPPFMLDLSSLQDARGAEAGQRGRRVGRQDGEGEEGDAGKHHHLLRNSIDLIGVAYHQSS